VERFRLFASFVILDLTPSESKFTFLMFTPGIIVGVWSTLRWI